MLHSEAIVLYSSNKHFILWCWHGDTKGRTFPEKYGARDQTSRISGFGETGSCFKEAVLPWETLDQQPVLPTQQLFCYI